MAAALSSIGTSDSIGKQRENVLRIFEEFRLSDAAVVAMLPVPWDALPEETLCSQEVYASFAHYLLHVYKPAGGASGDEFLAHGSIQQYLGIVLNLAKNKFAHGGNPASRLFFTCLDKDSNTDSAVWLHGIRRTINRTSFHRSYKSGVSTDLSATPLYLSDTREMSAAFMADVDAPSTSATRNLIIRSAFQSAGRSSEVAWLTWDGLEWDKYFNCVFVEVRPRALHRRPASSRVAFRVMCAVFRVVCVLRFALCFACVSITHSPAAALFVGGTTQNVKAQGRSLLCRP